MNEQVAREEAARAVADGLARAEAEVAAAECRGRQRGVRDGLLLALERVERLRDIATCSSVRWDAFRLAADALRDLVDQHPEPRGGEEW